MLAGRHVSLPYDPAWSLDGWVLVPDNPERAPIFSPVPDSGYQRYRAADHLWTTDEQQWAALCEALGRREWLADGGLAYPAGRRAQRSELDAALAAWTPTFDKHELMRSLQAAGVAAGAVLSPAELLTDEHHAANDFYRYVEREHAGCHAYYAPAVRMARSELGIRVPAPLFGEHTVEILRDVAGLSEAAIERLLAEKVALPVARLCQAVCVEQDATVFGQHRGFIGKRRIGQDTQRHPFGRKRLDRRVVRHGEQQRTMPGAGGDEAPLPDIDIDQLSGDEHIHVG